MSPAAVYVHYKSKADLLATISRIGHEAALRALEVSLIGDSHTERLRNAVNAITQWHANNHTLARVVQYELVALPESTRTEIHALRTKFEKALEREIREGVQSGEFEVSDPAGAALATLSLCIDVARWYSPHSHRSPRALGNLYAELIGRMVERVHQPDSV